MMKTALINIFFLTSIIRGYSQDIDIKDSLISFTSEKLMGGFTHQDLDIFFVSLIKFKNGKNGIILNIKSSVNTSAYLIKIDSVFFEFNNVKTHFSHPYRDTSFFNNNNQLSQTIIYELNSNETELLKTNTLNSIIFRSGNFPLKIDFSKNVRTSFSKMVDSTF